MSFRLEYIDVVVNIIPREHSIYFFHTTFTMENRKSSAEPLDIEKKILSSLTATKIDKSIFVAVKELEIFFKKLLCLNLRISTDLPVFC